MTAHQGLWQWRSGEESGNPTDGPPYLTCALLAAWPHGFFTRHSYPQLPDQLMACLHPSAPAFRVKQVHGKDCVTPTEMAQLPPAPGSDHPAADGIVSDRPDQGVWVASADCTPVLIGNQATGQVAAVHAGWRGTAAGIVLNALDRVLQSGGAVEDLRVALGPAIAGEVYQVDNFVALEVGQSLRVVQGLPTEQEQWDYLWRLSPSPLQVDESPEKCRLDVRRVIVLQLQQWGLQEDQWAIAPYCTLQTPKDFFSYRRTHTKEVQWSGIVSIDPKG